MNTEQLAAKLKELYIAKEDAGLLFLIEPDEINTCFLFENHFKYSERGSRLYRSFDYTENKHEVYKYLASKYLKDRPAHPYSMQFDSEDFYDKFWAYWLHRFEKIKQTINNVTKYYAYETINESDRVIPNVKNFSMATLFIVGSKHISELCISDTKLLRRYEHLIVKDIKRIAATDNLVNVYFHGIHEAFSIEMENYHEVLLLQRHLLNLRNQNNYNPKFRNR